MYFTSLCYKLIVIFGNHHMKYALRSHKQIRIKYINKNNIYEKLNLKTWRWFSFELDFSYEKRTYYKSIGIIKISHLRVENIIKWILKIFEK